MRLLPTLTAAILVPAACLAQDVSGTISGTLGLDDAAWVIRDAEGVPPSGWQETDAGTEVRIHGVPEGQPTSGENALTITFTLPDGAASTDAVDATVKLEPSEGPDVDAEGEDVDLQITNVSLQGERMVVSGGLYAPLTFGDPEALVDDPGNDLTTLEVNFQATLPQADAP